MTSPPRKHIINFGAGPAKLPSEVLKKAQKELVHFGTSGISVLEMSHRSSDFTQIMDAAESTLRQLLSIPEEYRVLFLQGGGVGLFSAIPLNFIARSPQRTADYIIAGSWSNSAAKEAEKYADKIHRITPPQGNAHHSIADQSKWNLNPEASYVYYCDNETIDGVEFPFIPETNGVPLVCDMSSNFLSRPFDITKFAAVFAGAQKNVGCAGVTVVIVRSDLLDHALPVTPTIWNFATQSANKSRVNTPPTFAVYMLGLTLEWIKKQGGVEAMDTYNKSKCRIIYDVIENSNEFYYCPVDASCRSCMNITLRIGGRQGNESLEKKFVTEAAHEGMIHLNGHRSVGGLRVSLYNAVTLEDVKLLATFMQDFQINNSN